MLHGVLTRLFAHAHTQAAAAAAGASSAASSSPAVPVESGASSFLQTEFSYHAFLGASTCKPESWERTWGVALAVLFLLYLCVILVRVCDQYLIPSLEVVAKKWGLSEDVAGVTLLAFGGSFPELAIHTIATIEGSEIGVGTVIGSAVFNVTCGMAIVSFLTPFTVQLFAAPLIRDSIVYILCLSLILVFFNWNARVMWWQALLMIVLYFAFVIGLILKYHHQNGTGIFSPEVMSPRSDAQPEPKAEHDDHHIGSAVVTVADSALLAPADDSALDSALDLPEPESANDGRRGSVSQRKRAGGDESDIDDEQASLLSRSTGVSSSSSSAAAAVAASVHTQPPPMHSSHGALHDYSDNPSPDLLTRVYYGINRPTDALNRWVIPNCTLPGHHKYYKRSFATALLVVLVISFTLMCVVQYMGCVSGIDHAVTGLLVLGVAASLPDIISVGVSARRGLGVMAVSGLVGSNVFDILVGLGFPWLLHIAIKGTSHVALTSGKVYVGAILAVISIGVFGLSILVNGMKLQKHCAWLPLAMYAVYIILVVKKVADPPEEVPTSYDD